MDPMFLTRYFSGFCRTQHCCGSCQDIGPVKALVGRYSGGKVCVGLREGLCGTGTDAVMTGEG